MKQQLNLRISKHSARQIDELMAKLGTNKSETILLAVERLYQQEAGKMNEQNVVDLTQANPYEVAEQMLEGCSLDPADWDGKSDDQKAMAVAEFYAEQGVKWVDQDGDPLSVTAYIVRYLSR